MNWRLIPTQTTFKSTPTWIRLTLNHLFCKFLPASSRFNNGWLKIDWNPTKTELTWLGSPQRIQQCSTAPLLIAGALIQPSSHVRDLGVIFDSDLSMSTNVNMLISVCFFHLRQLRLIRRSLDVEAAHALVRALIHSRLDYCNGVLAGLPVERLRRLHSIMKTSARLVLRLPSHASVTERMHRQLHWLDIPQRITYKLCVQTFKCLHNLASGYVLV